MEKIWSKTLSLSGSLFENDFIEQEDTNQSIVSSSQGISLWEWLERPPSVSPETKQMEEKCTLRPVINDKFMIMINNRISERE